MSDESPAGFTLSPLDRRIIAATQEGLALAVDPFGQLARSLDEEVDVVIERLRLLKAHGAIRRVAAVPHHYRIGMTANGMTVWDVDDDRIGELGARVAALSFVSHCYERPRRDGVWRYNLCAMVHGSSRAEAQAKAKDIEAVLHGAVRAHDILFSTRVLKKAGFRLGG